eukprot:scaffold934_cov69-Phaeocystis_antarctica.AAC.5
MLKALTEFVDLRQRVTAHLLDLSFHTILQSLGLGCCPQSLNEAGNGGAICTLCTLAAQRFDRGYVSRPRSRDLVRATAARSGRLDQTRASAVRLRLSAAPTTLRLHSRGTVASAPAHRPAVQPSRELRLAAQLRVAAPSPAPDLRMLATAAAAGAAAATAPLPTAEQRTKRPSSATSRNHGPACVGCTQQRAPSLPSARESTAAARVGRRPASLLAACVRPSPRAEAAAHLRRA